MKADEQTLGAPGNGLDPGRAASRAAELAADRAEAQAQLQAAQATLAELDAASPCPPVPDIVPEVLRDAARDLHRLRAEAQEGEAFAAALPTGPEPGVLAAAEQALADTREARLALPPAWRRTAGSLVSATGMLILIAALGLDAWVYLAPAALVVTMTTGLRMAAAAHRAASARFDEAMARSGLTHPEDLPGALAKAKTALAARTRAEEAARRRDEAAAHWARLAPGTAPEDVETLIERLSETEPTPAPERERARALAIKLREDAERELERVERESAELGSFL